MQLWVLAGLKLVGQAGRLEIQPRVDVAFLSPKSTGQASSLETQARFLYCSLRQNSFFRKPQSLFLRLSTDWKRPSISWRIICFA